MTRDNVDNIVVEVSIVVVVVVDVVCVDKQRAETLLKESMSTIKNVEEKQTNLSFSLPLLFSISSSLSLSLFLSPLLSLSFSLSVSLKPSLSLTPNRTNCDPCHLPE